MRRYYISQAGVYGTHFRRARKPLRAVVAKPRVSYAWAVNGWEITTYLADISARAMGYDGCLLSRLRCSYLTQDICLKLVTSLRTRGPGKRMQDGGELQEVSARIVPNCTVRKW